MKSFSDWLRGQRERRDAVGDLARDAERDACFPRQGELPLLKSHLREHQVSFDVLEALGVAFVEWRREQAESGED